MHMIDFVLTRKRNMKRVVLRVKDGIVCVSAPLKVSEKEIDKFVQSKANWIQKQLSKETPIRKEYDDIECLEKFNNIAEDVYPLIAKRIKPQPKIRVKDYKSRWGICYHKRGYIILNKQLFDKPIPAIEYVILHEYIHFLAQNHGRKFYKILMELMPDYKQRRKLLKSEG